MKTIGKLLLAILPLIGAAPFAHSQTLWRIGLNDGSSAEFTGTTGVIPSSYTIPSNWATQSTWPEWPSANYWDAWQTDINYSLTSIPAGGAIFTFQAVNAMIYVPQLAVYSNGKPCGIIQIVADENPDWGPSTYARLFRQPYQIYIPKEFLQVGTNTLHLSRLGHPYCTSTNNVYYMDFNIDYMEMDALSSIPAEPIHGKITYMGVSEGDTYFGTGDATDPVNGIANAAQSLYEWTGVAYCGNPAGAGFWSNNAWEQSLPQQLYYLQALKSLNMSVMLAGLSGEGTTDANLVDGQLSASDQQIINNLFTNFGSLVQFYYLCNEPCQNFSNVGYNYIVAAANYIKSVKPSTVLLTCPGYAYGGGYGTPVNWDDGSATGIANRTALDAICDTYGGHSFWSSWGYDDGDLAETIDADGTWVSGNPQVIGGWDKPFVSTECGSQDSLAVNISQIPTTVPFTEALDFNLRANLGFCDYMQVADAFNNGPYDILDGNYYDPTSWVAHPNGGYNANGSPVEPITKLQVIRRLALAYGTHGAPLPYTYNGIPAGTYPLIYFRAVDTSKLAPLPGSGATSNKYLLSFVNFDENNANTISVTVTMPEIGTYSGVCYGAGATIAASKSTVSLPTDENGNLTFTLTLPPGESTEYILTSGAPLGSLYNVGSPGISGSGSFNGTSYTVSGGGSDIWNDGDQFNFESQSETGNQTIITEVTSLANTSPYAKAGVMFRDSLASDAINVSLVATESNGVQLQWRSATGGWSSDLYYPAGTPTNATPAWLELVKNGTTYTGYYSSDGITWNLVGDTSVTLSNSNYLLGLAVTSHNNDVLCVAKFNDVSPNIMLSDADIGAPGMDYTLSGGGGDIWNNSDQFCYESQPETGDQAITVEVTSLANTSPYAKAGPMFRDSFSDDAINVCLVATESNGVQLQWRSATGGWSSYLYYPAGTPSSSSPVWLQLVKSGTTYTGYCSSDDVTWNLVGSTAVTLSNSNYLLGLAVTAHDNNDLTTATFNDMNIVPNAYSDADIGGPGATGSASANGISYTVSGAGGDIWNNSDQFNYDSLSETGDHAMVVEVTSLTNTSPYAKAGPMFRDSSASDAINVCLVATESNGVQLQWRSATGGGSNYSSFPAGTPSSATPVWLELVKNGTTYTGYCSSDGATWNLVGSTSVSLSNVNYLLGPAVTSHNGGVLCTGTFPEVEVY
jgi:hypothetical protein